MTPMPSDSPTLLPPTRARLRASLADRAGHAFPTHTMVHGFAHHARGEVEIEEVTPAAVRARIRGKRAESVLLRDDAGRLAVRCTCPARSLGLDVCKHQWATLLEVDRRGALEALRAGRGRVTIAALDPEPEQETAPATAPAKASAAAPSSPAACYDRTVAGLEFKTKLEAEGDGHFLRVPFDVKKEFGKARTPVKVTIGKYSYASTVAVYGGEYFIPVKKEHRDAAKLKAGDEVKVTLEADTSTRAVTVPPDLAAALRKDKAAKAAWQALSYSHQREHVTAIEEAKKPETRARRIAATLKMLVAPNTKKKS